MRESLYPFFGAGKYSITEYEKVKKITFPLDSHAILVVGTEVDHDLIIDKILRLKSSSVMFSFAMCSSNICTYFSWSDFVSFIFLRNSSSINYYDVSFGK